MHRVTAIDVGSTNFSVYCADVVHEGGVLLEWRHVLWTNFSLKGGRKRYSLSHGKRVFDGWHRAHADLFHGFVGVEAQIRLREINIQRHVQHAVPHAVVLPNRSVSECSGSWRTNKRASVDKVRHVFPADLKVKFHLNNYADSLRLAVKLANDRLGLQVREKDVPRIDRDRFF